MGGLFIRSSRRRMLSVLVGSLVLASLAVVGVNAEEPLDPVLGDPGLTYPDLQPNVTEVFAYRPILGFDGTQFTYGPAEISFDTHSQNIGDVALQLTTDEPGSLSDSPVSQCVSWYADHVCRKMETVGGFEWHEEHTHFHYTDFASYRLRKLLADGTPDYSNGGVVSVSDKVSFCLIDSTQVDPDASPTPYYLLCNPVQQGISAGWADIYTSDLEGQQLSLPGVPDGDYALVVDQDTANTVFETNDTNNRVVLVLRLAGLSTLTPTVEVLSKSWPTTGGGGTTTTTSTTTTSTTTTSTSTTTTTRPCHGGGGGGGGGGGNGHGGGGGGGGNCNR